jgi:hypothetical protein
VRIEGGGEFATPTETAAARHPSGGSRPPASVVEGPLDAYSSLGFSAMCMNCLIWCGSPSGAFPP